MHLDNPFHPRGCPTDSGCVAPTCFCSANQQCIITARTCDVCPTFKCIDPTPAAGGKKGPSAGAVAGAVVAVVLALGAVLGLFFWYRRRTARGGGTRVPQSKESVAAASDVLNRPDPNEKAIAQAHAQAVAASRSASAQSSAQPSRTPSRTQSNSRFVEHTPEEYYAAQQALAAGAGSRVQSPQMMTTPSHSQQPSRPSPSPPYQQFTQADPFSDSQSIQTTTTGTLDAIPIAFVPHSPGGTPQPPPPQHMNLEHLNVSKETFATGGTGLAPERGLPVRNSYMSSLTTATDLLNEAPVIVTQSQRQVLGISKAEVLRAPSTPNTPMTGDSTRAHPPSMLRPSMRSPLAATSFGPHDVVRESDEGHDPFGDEHSPSALRPASMATVATGAGTIIADIASAKRVNIGVARSTSVKSAGARTLNRMTSGKLVSPAPGGSDGVPSPGSAASAAGTLQQQQERALAIAHAKAREQGGGPDALGRRVSGSSVLTTSTRADSILESFPFVPPSPLSSLPLRTPPRSPLAQQAFGAEPRAQALLAPNRAQLGMSTGSQMSTASTGLGAFTFQLAGDAPPSPMPPSAFQQPQAAGAGALHPQRASLDTLALTSALSSYPLDGFAQAEAHYPPRN